MVVKVLSNQIRQVTRWKPIMLDILLTIPYFEENFLSIIFKGGIYGRNGNFRMFEMR